MANPLRIGLTGGIASGKSTASAALRDLGACVIDYDLLAREVVEPGAPALTAITQRFGDAVLLADGTLNRPALGSIVFGDETALRDLEAITHPAIQARAVDQERDCKSGVVVHDNPLLIEMGAYRNCDKVIVIDVPREVQVHRLIELRGMQLAEAEARIDAQTSRAQRTGVADYVIDNTGTLPDLQRQISAVWDELTALK